MRMQMHEGWLVSVLQFSNEEESKRRNRHERSQLSTDQNYAEKSGSFLDLPMFSLSGMKRRKNNFLHDRTTFNEPVAV